MAKPKLLIPASVPSAPLIRGGVYVGIDQSLTGTGLCIFNDQGELLSQDLFGTKPGSSPMDEINRFVELFANVHNKVVQIAAGRKVCAVMEDFAFAQAHQMAKLGGLGWHFRIMMSRTDWHFAACGTSVLKRMVTGKGNSEKDQVMMHVYKRWTFESSDNNIADAYALGRVAILTYAKPNPGTQGIRKDDLEVPSKLTIYR